MERGAQLGWEPIHQDGLWTITSYGWTLQPLSKECAGPWSELADKIPVLIPYKPEKQRIPRGREGQGRLEAAGVKGPEVRRGCSAQDLCCGERGDVKVQRHRNPEKNTWKSNGTGCPGSPIPGTAPEMCAPGTWGCGSMALGWHLEILEGFSNLIDSAIPWNTNKFHCYISQIFFSKPSCLSFFFFFLSCYCFQRYCCHNYLLMASPWCQQIPGLDRCPGG